MAAGIHAVLARQHDACSSAYLCHSLAEQRRCRMSVTRFDTQDRGRAVAMQKNITALKQAKDALQPQQETLDQREKLAAMSGLLASMAHELNNPLASHYAAIRTAAGGDRRPASGGAGCGHQPRGGMLRTHCAQFSQAGASDRSRAHPGTAEQRHRGSPPIVRLCTTAGQH